MSHPIQKSQEEFSQATQKQEVYYKGHHFIFISTENQLHTYSLEWKREYNWQMNQQSSYRAFRSDDNNNSITRKYAKNKILKNRENKKTKPKTEEWFKQQQHMFRDLQQQSQHMFRDLPQATATRDQIPSMENLCGIDHLP